MSTASTLSRSEWLSERRKSVGASEAAAAVGASPWMTPVELWQLKTARAAPQDESEAMRWGTILEPVILAEYERRQSVTVGRRQDFCRHPILPFMTATIDGALDDRLIEVKTTSSFSRGFGDEDTDDVPEQYLIQIAAQMAVTGMSRADLVVLVGGQRLKVYPLERDDGLVNAVEDRVTEFWRHVEADTPPTWGRMTPGMLAALNPRCSGEIALGEEVQRSVDCYEELGRQVANAESLRDQYKLNVLAAVGEMEFGRLPDGRSIKRYLKTTPARSVTVNYKESVSHYFKVLKGRS